MYSFLRGKLVHLGPTQAIVEVNGIGFEVEISRITFDAIHGKEDVLLFIQQIVRDDAHYLFGFSDKTAKQVFKKLISVSGIGPNTARLVLSAMTPPQIVTSIQNEREAAFKGVKGVGPKTAKRIILDLKDKLNDIEITDLGAHQVSAQKPHLRTLKEEAQSALMALGFKKPAISQALDQAIANHGEDSRVEVLIKAALQTFTGGG